jgi:hypothetical protein
MNVIPNWHLAFGFSVFGGTGQFVASLKFPETETFVIVSGAAEVFVRATIIWALEVPTAVFGKVSFKWFSF